MDMTVIISAASNAAGPAPKGEEYGGWKGRVLSIASDLATMVNGYESRENRKLGEGLGENEKVTRFVAKLVKVEKITKGEDAKVTKGKLTLKGLGSQGNEQNGPETIETAPLGTPEGDEEYVRAQSLVGQNVVIYKRNFLHPTDKSKKLKELVAIDPVSGFSSSLEVPQASPESTQKPSSRELIRAELNGLSPKERAGLRHYLAEQNIPSSVNEWSDAHLVQVGEWLNS